MATPEPSRRFTFALTAAVAGTTLAIGVTAATLLGWLRPAGAPAELPPPAPAAAEIAAAPVEEPAPVGASHREHEHEHEHEHEDDDD
ncbi:MAG: hypothetical protein ACM31C_12985 [Acidobacteriota bacterium]